MANRTILKTGFKGVMRFLIVGIISLLITGCAVVHRYGGYSGKVIDTETKEPLEGAAVLAVYYTQQYGPAGSISHYVDAQETMTDRNGEFRIPANWAITFRPLQTFDPHGWFTIFKPEYGCYPRHKGTRSDTSYKGIFYKEKYVTIELPSVRTREERLRNIGCRPVGVPDSAMRTLTKIINIENLNLGLEVYEVVE